jgi:hypothetical protein
VRFYLFSLSRRRIKIRRRRRRRAHCWRIAHTSRRLHRVLFTDTRFARAQLDFLQKAVRCCVLLRSLFQPNCLHMVRMVGHSVRLQQKARHRLQ